MNRNKLFSIGFYLLLISPFAYAATQVDLRNGVKNLLPRANGGFGLVPNASVVAAAASAPNSAGGLLVADSNGDLPEANLPNSVLPIAASPVLAAGNMFLYNGSEVVAVGGSSAPEAGQVLTATGADSATWQTPSGGSGIVAGSTLTAGDMLKAGGAGSAVPATRGVDYAAPATVSTNIAGYIMPTGSISDAAATVTLGTALPVAYPNGVWQYVEAGKPRADLPAAWRWTLMSTTTLCQICQETYDPTTQKPYIPASCTAFTDATPGTITGVITTYIPWIQFSVPANSLGKNGKIVSESWVRTNNSAGNKQVRITFGASNVVDRGYTTSTGELLYAITQNNGVVARQRSYYRTNMGLPNSVTASTEDTTAAKTYYFYLRLNTATDVLGIDGTEITVSGAPE